MTTSSTTSQTVFRRAILDAAEPVPKGLNNGQGAPAGRRFSVYRNNVAVSLTDALRTGFPTIVKLLGDQNFDGLAGIFLRQHPPVSPLMMHYGEGFPAFLANMPALSHLGYLQDVAQLELALRRSYHAADATPLDPTLLQSMPPEELAQHRMSLAPALQIIRSRYPLYDIWAYNMADGPQPGNVAQNVLITRPEFDPEPHPLPLGGATFIAALQNGQTFGDAFETTHKAAPGFDLGSTLALLLQGQAITMIEHKETT